MNATNYAAKYTAKAMDAYIAYAETKDARDSAMYAERARHYEVLAQSAKESAQRDAVKVGEAAQQVPVAVEAPAAKVGEAQPAKTRCPHRKLIARFFAIAREHGMDTSKAAKPAMRHAMEAAMKRCVDSRSEVTANEWLMLGDLIKVGRLAW
jgi:hypothetical protein